MIAPYYEKDGVAIYHGDALSILLDYDGDPFSAVVSDPPYSSGNLPEAMKQKSNPRLRGWQWKDKIMATDQLTTLGFLWIMRELLLICREHMSSGAALLLFIDWRNWGNLVGVVESVGVRVNNMVVWDKQSMGMGNGFRNQHELVLCGSKGPARVCSRAMPNVIQARRAANLLHQSPKPVDLMQKLLGVVTAPGDLVLDPFMGSGSTLVAARGMGRRAIGIEVEERYCETAAKRLQQGALDLSDAMTESLEQAEMVYVEDEVDHASE